MITVLEIERRYAEMRAAQFREEAAGYPPGSQERRDALYFAFSFAEKAERLGRIERSRRGIFPAALDQDAGMTDRPDELMINLNGRGASELVARRRAREAADKKEGRPRWGERT